MIPTEHFPFGIDDGRFFAIPDGEDRAVFPGVTLIDPQDIKVAYFDGKESLQIDFKSGGNIEVKGDQAKKAFELLLVMVRVI